MRAVSVWADKVHDREGVSQSVHAVCFRPDGTQLIVAAGTRVLVYETAAGDMIKSLKGHRGPVYCLAYSNDGSRFASGGADNVVVIWSSDLEGELKYSHNESIQALAFNPATHSLISCTASDFGFWSAEQKNVEKIRVPSRICTCSWTNDGQYVALGLFNGNVSIRNRDGQEKVVIQRPGGSPVWSLQWNPNQKEKTDVLAVCDWNQRISFYRLSGRQIGKDRVLGYDPCSVSYFSEGEYLVVGGSNKKAGLYSRDGVHLADIGKHEGWIWACAVRPGANYVAVGSNDGTIALYQLVFSTVHGLYKDRYAYRRLMTEVMVQDLGTSREFRINCRELVKKISIYKDKLAVQMPNHINIYEIVSDERKGSKFRLTHKIKKAMDCNLLVVCAHHIIICQERRLQSFTFDGQKEREWTMDALIRYIRVAGGPEGREGLLVGLKSGAVVKIFLDNAFPVSLIKQQSAVRCLDLSASRRKLAVVDDNNVCQVYDVETKELLFQEPNANSVAWNSQSEDMLCFSGNGQLHIKAGDFPVHSQKMNGFVVGFSGSSIYCLHVHTMRSVDVPQSHSMFQYLRKSLYAQAYDVACLGVTEADWRVLALEAFEGLDFETSKRAFVRVRDLHALQALDMVRAREDEEADVLRAMVFSLQGKFDDAARLFQRSGRGKEAVDMFANLRLFDKAKQYLDESDSDTAKHLMKKQAEWVKTANDPALAIDILETAGEEMAAINMMGENGMEQKLIDKARTLNKAETDLLSRIVYWLRKLDRIPLAAEVCHKMGDEKMLMELYVGAKKWQDALTLAHSNPELASDVYQPYADWLAENDRFQEAQRAYRKAGLESKAAAVLRVLTENAIGEQRFDDAAFYYWQIASSTAHVLKTASEDAIESLKRQYEEQEHLADVYNAYHAVNKYIQEPFTSFQPEAIFHMARFLCCQPFFFGRGTVPQGVSQVVCLLALAKQSRSLGANKLARQCYDRLMQMKLPAKLRSHVELGAVSLRGRMLTDNEDLQPLCFRCTNLNDMLGPDALLCSSCKHPLVLSRCSYETLPLVEFVPDADISDEEAIKLIANDASVSSGGGADGDTQVMSLEGDDGQDPFLRMLENESEASNTYMPLRADRDMLRQMPSNEVFVVHLPYPLGCKFYRNVMPDISIRLDESSNRFFLSDNYELMTLQLGYTPFSRQAARAAEQDNESKESHVVLGEVSSSEA